MAILISLLPVTTLAQSGTSYKPKLKGSFYFFWGWNRSDYTTSDIHFKGEDFDFSLYDVRAKDKPSPYDPDVYFDPGKFTIPQYNFRIGYFINDHYSLSIGADHMKYVMINEQTVRMTGIIRNTQTDYDGEYQDAEFVISRDFLLFEHTDGLNYENIELRRFDALLANRFLSLNTEAGLGLGAMVPRTNTTLLNNPRYDEFHLAGYGMDAVVALNLTILHYFFIQSEIKGGYINMPDIRITMDKGDKAAQHFFFTQYNVVFGARIHLH